MRTFRTTLLAVSFVTLTSQAFAQDPGADLSAASNQAMLQTMQQNRWSGQDPYHRGNSYSGPDYTCPQQPVVVGAPGAANAAPQQSSVSQTPSQASVASAADSNATSTAPVYTNQDTLPAPGQDANPAPKQPYAILTCGTFVRLEFISPVTSKTARVGDPISLRVAEDIKVGTTVIVPKGALADGTVTFVRHTGPGGLPGSLGYELNALRVNDTRVPLWRAEGRTGDPKFPGPEVLIPVAGAFAAFRHGKDAEIKPGNPVTAVIAADITLPLP